VVGSGALRYPPGWCMLGGYPSPLFRWQEERAMPLVMNLDDLPRTEHAHEFIGAEHGDVPFSIILVHAPPGAGPQVHQHPYAEVFVVESGEASFRLGDDTMVVRGGQVVVGPANVPHGFTNTGTSQLRLTAIHGAPEFTTEWLADPDSAWASNPEP